MNICAECGKKYGFQKKRSEYNLVTIHMLECQWCNQVKEVSHYRNYGYPNLFRKLSKQATEKELAHLEREKKFRRLEKID